jgi:hypothetical protein
MGIELSGFDDFKKKLDRLSKNAASISGRNEVPFTELFPDSFMGQYTDFQTLQQMLDASGIEKPEDIKGEAWNGFVVGHSRFGGWDEMNRTAGAEWAKAKINA